LLGNWTLTYGFRFSYFFNFFSFWIFLLFCCSFLALLLAVCGRNSTRAYPFTFNIASRKLCAPFKSNGNAVGFLRKQVGIELPIIAEMSLPRASGYEMAWCLFAIEWQSTELSVDFIV
jgi:hypothetical protein